MLTMNNFTVSEKNPGDKFIYKGIEWIALGEEQNGLLCVTTKPICRKEFDKSGGNNWRTSSLREWLNIDFASKLDNRDFLPIECDLVADNGDTSYGKMYEFVGLLSCDLYRKYRDIIPQYDDRFWTCTPCTSDMNHTYRVRYVGTSGELFNHLAGIACGIIPAVIFKKEINA